MASTYEELGAVRMCHCAAAILYSFLSWENTGASGRPTSSARSCRQSLHQHYVAVATFGSLQQL